MLPVPPDVSRTGLGRAEVPDRTRRAPNRPGRALGDRRGGAQEEAVPARDGHSSRSPFNGHDTTRMAAYGASPPGLPSEPTLPTPSPSRQRSRRCHPGVAQIPTRGRGTAPAPARTCTLSPARERTVPRGRTPLREEGGTYGGRGAGDVPERGESSLPGRAGPPVTTSSSPRPTPPTSVSTPSNPRRDRRSSDVRSERPDRGGSSFFEAVPCRTILAGLSL